MRPNRKQKLFISLSIFLVFAGGSSLYCSDGPRGLNVILITLDALRPDHLGCYGYKKNTSPNIDKLAKEGVLFTQAISQTSWTCPSFFSLITSTYPSTNQVYYWDRILPKSIITLTEILKEKGYCNGFISGHGGTNPNSGFNRGFDTFVDIVEVRAGQITNEAISWIKNNRNKNFFLWIHYMDTHSPYQPPFPYNKLFLPADFIKLSDEFLAEKYKWIGVFPIQSLENTLTEEDREYYISQYDGVINFIDEQIGILLKNLKNLNLFKKTFIIITADHGENLADQDKYFGHGGALYEELIKVPLILRCKGLFPKGKIINHQIQLIDIMPTILDILSVDTNVKMEGKTLLPLILNKKIKSSYYAFSEVRENENGKEYILYSIRTANRKLIYCESENNYEFYNLKKDPHELNNLVSTEKEQFKFLKEKLEEWMVRPKPNIIPLTTPVDEQTKERLKSLGYLQ